MVFRNPTADYSLQELAHLLYLNIEETEQLLISGLIPAIRQPDNWSIPAYEVENYIRQTANLLLY